MKIISWNCNGIRARLDHIKNLMIKFNPEVLCLQETKASDEVFPSNELNFNGYDYQIIRGEKGYNGVAIISKIPFADSGYKLWVNKDDCRHLWIKLENGLIINNFYVPAGGDIPDPLINEKFDHKLKFLSELKKWASKNDANRKEILLGDLNIAPLPEDVWSHKQLLNVVSHTPIEVEALNEIQNSGNYLDVIRYYHPPPKKLFSWWSYRSRDWELSNRGRRLDHIWTSPILINKIKNVEILKQVRSWEKPSDHAPILIELSI